MISRVRFLPAAALVAALAASTVSARQPRDHVEVPRDQWQRVSDIFRELGVSAGANIADVGAGHGYFTSRLAKAVGPAGRVWAVDVNPVSLRELREAIGTELGNVEIVRGDEDNPRLPINQLDGALIVNAYHEFAEYAGMLRHLHAALKPGGRLVLVEPIPRTVDTTRGAQTKRHSIAIELAEADLIQAGFEIATRDLAFVTRPEHMGEADRAANNNRPTDWLLVARKPGSFQPSAISHQPSAFGFRLLGV